MSTNITPSSNEQIVLVSPNPNPTPAHKKLSRRNVLALAGTGTLVLVAGGGVWRAADQGVFSTGEGPAYEPWNDWRTTTKGPLNLVRAAILAANPHNSQPWLFRVTQTQIDLFSDRRRNLGIVDPFLIEMHIGLGCSLENLLLAAAANGYITQVTLSPDASDETLVARIELAPGSAPVSDLYNVIPLRHTNRYPYDTRRPVTLATLDALSALGDDADVRVFWFATAEKRKTVGTLLVEAAHAFVADKAQDGVDTGTWWRGTWQDIQQHRDGITLDAAGLPDLTRAVGKMLPLVSVAQQDSSFLQNTAEQVKTAGAFGLLAIHNRQDRTQQVRAGRLWEHMHVWATKEGLAMQPLNQATERAAREIVLGITPHFGDALYALMGDAAWQPILTFRTGYATHEGLRSPRRVVNDVVK
ncbi:MAG: nitroreductase family protein [Ktedonobacteraceae bacterium]